MYPSVRDKFISFSILFEGQVSHMYLDTKGLVTIGIGNLIDPVSLALRLPFVYKSDSSVATQDEIQTEWQKVKSRRDLATVRGYLQQFDALTTLKLTEDDIDTLVLSKLESNEATLKRTPEFADLDEWPADAQLGLFSMAWAAGPGFGASFPKVRAACAAKDWNTAAIESRMTGVRRRNDANRILFSNAAQVTEQGLDFSILQYPCDLAAGEPPVQPSDQEPEPTATPQESPPLEEPPVEGLPVEEPPVEEVPVEEQPVEEFVTEQPVEEQPVG